MQPRPPTLTAQRRPRRRRAQQPPRVREPDLDHDVRFFPCFRNGPDGIVTETTSPAIPFRASAPAVVPRSPLKWTASRPPTLNEPTPTATGSTIPTKRSPCSPTQTSSDTDSDGINDGVEVNGAYGNPPQASDPRNNNTDGDAFDDGEEDTNFNGVLDAGETDPLGVKIRGRRPRRYSKLGGES